MNYLPEVARSAGTARVSRDTARGVEYALGRGLVKAAEVESLAFVAETSLMCTAKLTSTEQLLIGVAPLGEARYKTIVDGFAMMAAQKIMEMR